MRRNKKYEEEKELRRLYEEYRNTWRLRKEHGHFIDIPPYRSGWSRTFTLRSDIKNRKDARWIRQALDLINTETQCHRKDFLSKGLRSKTWKPIPQKLCHLSVEKYEGLPTAVQKYFVKGWVSGRYVRKAYEAYFFKFPWFFVFKIEPRMVTQRWIPDSEWESYCGEILNKIERNNLWPKMGRVLGWRTYRNEFTPRYKKHIYGEDIPLNYDEVDEEWEELYDQYNWECDQYDYYDEYDDWKEIA